jgi:hypothetical protein
MTHGKNLTAAFIALLFSVVSSSAAGKAMSGDELRQLLSSGKTLKLGSKEARYSGELVLNADGTGKGSATTSDGSRTFNLEGTWKISGNEFCRVWTEFDGGREICEIWVRVGDNTVIIMNGEKRIGIASW